ncbi:MAG: ABC transporter ATP-binding protein [Firmicutes bacterium]|uniref:ABC transporter ATP-binding protein n=1 Tax=Candidatus Onthovivens merdipullorum TaxID=2840889 RepID=A0A9D9GWA0_9BACL|nr:ABC transporter ATP-binding protein [Candidatus Onthovivens merdipullorum]
MDDNKYVIEMEHISKSFPGIKANDDITLRLKQGEIHALLGENGAGKSTLMSILFGLYQPDEGQIKINGEVKEIKNPNDANKYGIGMVHQHFKLVDVFTPLENIILGVEPVKYKFLLTKKEAREKVLALSEKYKLHIDLDSKVEDLTVGMQQKTEILKMLYRDNNILIFDEPTAVLTPQEIDELLIVMKELVKEGKSILFITHKLDEITKVADRVSVLRKGKLLVTKNVSETNKEELSRLMVGRDVSFTTVKKDITPGKTILKVRNLVMQNKIHKSLNKVNGVSFDVKEGEIVCIAGVDGNGQSELIYGITGINKIKSGNVFLNDVEITNLSIFKRNNLGMSHIPEDRQKHGLVLDFPLSYNLVLENYWMPDYTKWKFILDEKKIRKHSDNLIEKYDIRSSEGSKTIVRSMSGGNQQKAIVGREIDRNPNLLIAVQPTRGLDVGAIEYIHNEIVKVRDNHHAVLLVSYELDEVMNLADRILVMFNGKIVGEFKPKEVTIQELGLYMAGAKQNYDFKEVTVNE